MAIGIPIGQRTGVQSVCSKKPDMNGNVALTAEDVQALGAIEDNTYPGCYYRMVDGEKEWFNPPMAENVEYRTTERLNNLPVYVKMIYGIAYHGRENVVMFPGAARPLGYYGYIGENKTLPIIKSIDNIDDWVTVEVNGERVIVRAGNNIPDWGFKIALRYTKNLERSLR